MRTLIIKSPYLLFILFWILISSACQKENVSNLPGLQDEIPYEVLGQGTIVFARTGPSGKYSGFYVIDVNEKRSWFIEVGGFVRGPSISPNGRRIAFSKAYPGRAFSSDFRHEIHIMDINGKNVVEITEYGGVNPSWTPDGLKILYSGASAILYQLYMQSPSKSPSDQILIKELDVISSPVSVSIDRRIAFVGREFRRQTISLCVMDFDGENMELLVPRTSEYSIGSPVFSPDGQNIAYLEVETDGHDHESLEIKLINVNSRNLESLGKFEASGRFWTGYGVSLCWSPDGTKLLFNRPEGDIDKGKITSYLYLINADGSGLTKITSSEGVCDAQASWSR